MTFKDWQLNSVTFQAWKMKFLNSMIFQVFHDQYQPCSKTECSLLAEGTWQGGGKETTCQIPGKRGLCSTSFPEGTLMLGDSGGGLHPRGVKAHSQRGKIPSQSCKIKTIYIGLRRLPLNCIHHWRLYFYKIWVYSKNNSKKMGLALKSFMKRWFLVHPWRFWYKLIFTPTEILHFYNLPMKNAIGPLNAIAHLVHLLNLLAN